MPRAEPLRPGDPEAIAAYRIAGRLGEGGQGVVYLAQAPDGRPVAVKVLRESARADDRFAREVAAARRVEPFCVAQVLDASTGGRPYIVSEYVEGPSLQEAGRHHGADLQRLAVSTATALAAIHQAGIVHRDFKPANVLLGRDGPRVIDFGIAHAADSALTVTSGIVGTPAYMAPEQLAGAYVGPAADVFAWASVVVFAGTGRPPFGDDTMPAVINRILNHEPFLGGLPEPLRPIVHACLAKDPAARPGMQDVLLRLLGASHPATPAPGGHHAVPAGTLPPRRPKRRLPVIAALSGALVASLVTGVAVWNARSAEEPVTPVLAADSGEPSPSPARSRKRARTPSRSSPTSTPTVRVTRPTPTPSRARTTARPTPSKRPATTRPAPTASRTKAATAASFSLSYVRVAGSSKINTEGVTCYSGTLGFGIGLDASRAGAPFSYQWIVDGQVIESGSRKIPSYGRSDYFGSKKQIAPELGSTHTVVFQLTSPVRKSISTDWTMC
ncbi:serine/threonine protein kinase [Nonomuraea thailandensis]|uniref:non-specific serine/threonine protein kinase n=1 Tax=Nonomuraea thailandensis TaxID=1188745 RepID=A0A9X2GIM8_9ACTN|nr:serine/threonine protein kinase [Nonomuraea thailandensis]MCP2354808.1 serine/threonine protein kinase [Nonomuraea thailandensis]